MFTLSPLENSHSLHQKGSNVIDMQIYFNGKRLENTTHFSIQQAIEQSHGRQWFHYEHETKCH